MSYVISKTTSCVPYSSPTTHTASHAASAVTTIHCHLQNRNTHGHRASHSTLWSSDPVLRIQRGPLSLTISHIRSLCLSLSFYVYLSLCLSLSLSFSLSVCTSLSLYLSLSMSSDSTTDSTLLHSTLLHSTLLCATPLHSACARLHATPDQELSPPPDR